MRRRTEGFTLIEATISGVILLVGMILMAQIVRSSLDTTAPGAAQSVISSAVVEQYMRSQIALIKASRSITASPIPLPALPLGSTAGGTLTAIIYQANIASGSALGAGNNSVNSGVAYTLKEFDLTISMGATTLAHTRFWKHEGPTSEKVGL